MIQGAKRRHESLRPFEAAAARWDRSKQMTEMMMKKACE